MKIYLLAFFLSTISCNNKGNIDRNLNEAIDIKTDLIFNYNYFAPTFKKIIEELGELPNETNMSAYCNWLKEIKTSLVNKILKDNSNKHNFHVVGYAQLPENKCLVDYNGKCEQIANEEIPLGVINIFEENLVCPKPEKNRFKPQNFTNSFSKTLENNNGYKCIIQVWFNNEKS